MTASALRSGRSGGNGALCFGYASGSAAAAGQCGRRAVSADHVAWRAGPQALISIGQCGPRRPLHDSVIRWTFSPACRLRRVGAMDGIGQGELAGM